MTLGNPHPLSEPPFSLSRTGKKSTANQAPCIKLSGDTSSCCPGGGGCPLGATAHPLLLRDCPGGGPWGPTLWELGLGEGQPRGKR